MVPGVRSSFRPVRRRKKRHDFQRLQAAVGGSRSLKACGAGEVDPSRGQPSTLHLWWARWPLASSRAVSKALLLTDPRDVHCPEAFKKKAPQIFLGMNGRRARQAGA